MKAIVQDTYGTADVLQLEGIDEPVAGSGDVLLRVHAASVFIGDWHIMTGLPYLIRMRLIEAGKVTPVIDKTYPFREVPEAIRHLEEGHARGKVIITV